MVWVFLSLCSALFFAAKDIIAKKLLKKDTSGMQLTFEEFLMLFLGVGILFWNRIEFFSFSSMWYLYLLKSLCFGLSTLIYFRMLKRYDISHVSPFLNIAPLVVLLFSATLLSEIITFYHVLGILCIIFSTYLLEITYHHYDFRHPHRLHILNLKKKDKKFYILVILMVVTFALSSIFDKKILDHGVNIYSNMFFTGAIIFGFLFIYYLYEGTLFRTFKNIYKEPDTLVVGVFANLATAFFLFALTIPYAKVALIAPLKRLSSVVDLLFGGLLFHEKHLKSKLVAVVGMIIGVVLIVI